MEKDCLLPYVGNMSILTLRHLVPNRHSFRPIVFSSLSTSTSISSCAISFALNAILFSLMLKARSPLVRLKDTVGENAGFERWPGPAVWVVLDTAGHQIVYEEQSRASASWSTRVSLYYHQVETCRNIRAGSQCRLTYRFQMVRSALSSGQSTSTGCLITVIWHIHVASGTKDSAYFLSLEQLFAYILSIRSLLAI